MGLLDNYSTVHSFLVLVEIAVGSNTEMKSVEK